ncbi:sulfatase-like hydrolase/transferase [Halorubrum sp. Eb13]|uniref:sulfatase-like hydrolase/transferase n=1 Tax=Halorubrum sp. Eb13 TaxID=1383843 RepID=UPI001595D1DE|nr:sulfatase-like hydrolase/transferase [Halorubrum sp. Eb13]
MSADALRHDAFEEVAPDLHKNINGVNFTNAVATANATAHSMPAMAAGVYADTSGYGIDKSEGLTTMAEKFSEAGYQCGFWTDNYLVSSEYDYDRGFSAGNLSKKSWKKKSQLIVNQVPSERFNRLAKWIYFHILNPVISLGSYNHYYSPAPDLNNDALDWLSLNKDTNKFCWIHYMDTHHPFEPPEEYLESREFSKKYSRSDLSSLSSDIIMSNGGSEFSDGELNDIQEAYLACCEYWSDQLLLFIKTLKDRGHFDPAKDVMVITSDHGEGFDPDLHNMIGHTPTPAFWEDMVRVPLVISHPNWKQDTINQQVSMIDLMPTILSTSGIDVPNTVEGYPAESPIDLVRKKVYFSAIGPDEYYFGIRSSEGWKLFSDRINTETGPEMESGRENDVRRIILTMHNEKKEKIMHVSDLDSISYPENNDLSKEWDELVDALETKMGGFTSKKGENKIDDELKQHLHDLGYVDDIPENK